MGKKSKDAQDKAIEQAKHRHRDTYGRELSNDALATVLESMLNEKAIADLEAQFGGTYWDSTDLVEMVERLRATETKKPPATKRKATKRKATEDTEKNPNP